MSGMTRTKASIVAAALGLLLTRAPAAAQLLGLSPSALVLSVTGEALPDASTGDLGLRYVVNAATTASCEGGGTAQTLCVDAGDEWVALATAENGLGGGGGASTAAELSYDNTASGMSADDVQAAIEEVAAASSTYAPISHVHAAADTTSGTFGNDRISAGSVTQHETALEAELDLSDLQGVASPAQLPAATTSARGGVVLSTNAEATAGEVVTATDSRLTDSRTPSSTLAHASSHAAAGSDPVTITAAQVGSLTLNDARVDGSQESDEVAIGGDGTGTASALVVTDDSHAHTGATISGLDAADTSTGSFGDGRVDGSLEADEVNPTLGTQTQGPFVASVATTAPLAGGGVAAEGSTLTLSLSQNAGTDVTADLEEETHATEHSAGGADPITATNLAAPCSDAQVLGGNSGATGVECQADDDTAETDAKVANAITVAGGAIGTTTIDLVQSTTPAPTVEGRAEWDTNDDRLVIGDGAAPKTFYPGAHAGASTDGGAATTSTALAANPADCSASQFANAIDASGNLTCATPSGGGARTVSARTEVAASPYAITSGQTGYIFTNEGATARTYLALPTAVAGLEYTFDVQDADGIRIVANTGDTLRIEHRNALAAGYCEAATVGNSVTLKAINATEWTASAVAGQSWYCSPASIATPTTWFRGQDLASGVISTWEDYTVGDHDATQATNTARPVRASSGSNFYAHFDGSDDYLALPNFMTGYTAGELFMVIKATTDPNTGGWMHLGSDTQANRYSNSTDSLLYISFATTSRKTTGNPVQDLSVWHVLDVWSASNDYAVYINNDLHYSTATNTVGYPTGPFIGRNSAAVYFPGDVAEFIFYDRKLTVGERAAVYTYLAAIRDSM